MKIVKIKYSVSIDSISFNRESRLLFTPGVTSQSAEEAIVAVVAHELAHMWFGDIVTMQWYTSCQFFFFFIIYNICSLGGMIFG